jgi:hypothetical protein
LSLTDHGRAARILADSFMDEFNASRPEVPGRDFLLLLSVAYNRAAACMDEQARADIEVIGGTCTLDHSRLKGPTKCVCGATAATR